MTHTAIPSKAVAKKAGARRAYARTGMAFVLTAVLMAAAAGTANPQAGQTVVRLGVVGVTSTMYYSPLVVALQKNLFEREGVQVKMTVIGPDDNLVRAIAAGALDLGIPETSIAINGNAHGAPVTVIATLTDRYPYDLFAQPSIKSYAGLRGKTISHWTVAPEVSVALIRRLLASGGLKEGDYNLIAGGNLAARYAALSSRAVDASILTTPFDLLARKNGFTDLGGLYDIPAVFAGIAANSHWASGHPDVVVATLKAMILGFRYAATSANRSDVVKMLSDLGKMDPANVDPAYDRFFLTQTYLTSWDLAPSPRSMRGVVDILADLGQIPKGSDPLTYFDLSYLNRALRELGR
jgi:ABC-type nitrate/sulfonate/bicarbonate transport system substrate-binding protein